MQMIFISGLVSRISFTTCWPLITGILRSVITRSNRSGENRKRDTASTPLDAVVTWCPDPCRTRLTSVRSDSSSSATSMLAIPRPSPVKVGKDPNGKDHGYRVQSDGDDIEVGPAPHALA